MLFLSFFPPYASLFCRNAPCPPASWVDSGSVHPWHRVWVSHAAVPGADWVCCQWEQHSCGPSGGGESGRPSQCDGFGSGKTQDKLIADDSLCIDTHQAVKSSILSVCDLCVQWRRELVTFFRSGQCADKRLQKLSSHHWMCFSWTSWPRRKVWLGGFPCFLIFLTYFLNELWYLGFLIS